MDNNNNGVTDGLEMVWIPLIMILVGLIGSGFCEHYKLEKTLGLFAWVVGGGLTALGFNPTRK